MFKRSLLSLALVLSCAAAQASETDTNTGRFAAVRNLWTTCVNSDVVTSAGKMINPTAYVAACREMYKAGFKGALPTLWKDHKAVIAGTTVAVAIAAVAYNQGWFAKAKNWVSSKLS